jgi:FkbM family methyltransferase
MYRTISAFRAAFGAGDEMTVRRGGLNWRLDLSQGIDLSIYLLGAFERRTVRAMRSLVRNGNVVLDIGANVGAHTLYLAQAVGPSGAVIAFEPTDFAFRKLLQNVALNPTLASRMRPEQILLTNDSSSAIPSLIYSSWPLTVREDLHEKHLGELKSTSNATAERLDDYVRRNGIDQIDFIKIDVDGHEYSVLSGALDSLQRLRPALLMELSPYVHAEKDAESFGRLVALLSDAGYSMHPVGSRKPLPLDAEFLARLVPDGAGINVVLIPS